MKKIYVETEMNNSTAAYVVFASKKNLLSGEEVGRLRIRERWDQREGGQGKRANE
jgi:hypothetical protein